MNQSDFSISNDAENSLKKSHLSGIKFHQNDRPRKWIFDDFDGPTEKRRPVHRTWS